MTAATAHFPLKILTVFILITSLIGMWILHAWLTSADRYERGTLLNGIIGLSMLVGIHGAAILAIHVLAIHYAPGPNHFISLAVSTGALAFTGRRVIRPGVVKLLGLCRKSADIASESVITPFTGEKLQEAVEFLNENYRRDISREGLAEKLGMSVDHLGRKFKAYMGKRMGDYINELRVRDAAEALEATDMKIIDIAYDNGFESLATFNRVFLKITGETPTGYRRSRRNVYSTAPREAFQELQ